ncbi:cytochrome c maturation protein CcmE [Neorickettsia sennetsu]|uniref:Cytochrome c-type biogenesis protein CcmE n=1 Tax=Ehrlichia sennetsu (strain ATCC VR-367 / Miyayama) TaxID=222891 RepID=CCME_EHRS3|nr:cytochrome c maturation protein CcmE [Neorickettsia sennetsu]Q2GCU8.1 RecName: Full=Cytochrome c-type biogenesis protein CcmE; AltName: Full=Cytochrome c maturation protein E; AltName: Full=Heme chaperone CcmE [Neorickettsia sennetsu str. Miyayama]ABD46381.1 putative cytochrome c-type biogenesis protein CcmE [Neorickettsia sennetsu str. Miyayama]
MLLLRWKRFWFLSLGILLFSGVVSLMLFNLSESISFFYLPSDVARVVASNREIKVGGIIKAIKKSKDGVRFLLSDGAAEIEVLYEGILPSLVQDGINVVVVARFEGGLLLAKRVLVKHDERYYPPEDFIKSVRGE